MKQFFYSFSLILFSCNLMAQEPIKPSEQLLEKIPPLRNSQAKTISFFDAPHGLVGVGVFTKKFEKRVFYTNKSGDFLLSGMFYDVSGKRNINNSIIAQMDKTVDMSLPAEWTDPISQLSSVTIGTGSRHIYAFVDLNCPYCHRLQKSVEEKMESGEYQNITMHYIPIGIMRRDSDSKAESILGTTDNEVAYSMLKQGFKSSSIVANEEVRANGRAFVVENEEAFKRFPMAGGVPFVIGNVGDDWVYSPGVPQESFFSQFLDKPQPQSVTAP